MTCHELAEWEGTPRSQREDLLQGGTKDLLHLPLQTTKRGKGQDSCFHRGERFSAPDCMLQI